ncbi:hypothetical protein Tco_0033695 [Tanacetum coccineum]
MRPRRLLKLLKDCECNIQYHPRKANAAVDALSRKKRAKPLRMRALAMTSNSSLPPQIHEAQVEALKKENVKDENLHDTDKNFETRLDRTLYIRSRNCQAFYHKPTKDNKLLLHDLGNRDHQKNYADVRRKPLEFQVGGKVMLEVSSWKGVICFSKRGKLNPRYIEPFKILAKVGTVAFILELSQQLSRFHSTFHVPNLEECLSNETLVSHLGTRRSVPKEIPSLNSQQPETRYHTLSFEDKALLTGKRCHTP